MNTDAAEGVADMHGTSIERQIREFVRKDDPPNHGSTEAREYAVNGVCSLVERVAGTSLGEIDNMIAELQRLRVFLVSEGERLLRELAHYGELTREVDRAQRALRLQRLDVSEREDPFAAVIRCTADPTKADKRTRSKWSRVMRYAAGYKPDSEPLDLFIRRKGAAQLPCEPGLNCAHPQIRSRPTGACRGGPFRFQLFFARWRQSSVAPAVCQPTIADPDVSPTSRSFR
jgi:hypothetical protein